MTSTAGSVRLLLLFVLLSIAAGVFVYRVARAPEAGSEVAADPALPPAATGRAGEELAAPERAVGAGERVAERVAANARRPERARGGSGTTLAGHVVLPPATPIDEALSVEIVPFPMGSEHASTAAVDASGRFEAPLPSGARRVRFGLRGRYLYLDAPVELSVEEDATGVVLEPQLGGRLVVRVVPPRGYEVESLADVELELTPGVTTLVRPPAERVAEDQFEFHALPTELLYGLVVQSDRFADSARDTVRVFPGRVRELEVELARGVRLAGVVQGPGGRAVEGARIQAVSKRVAGFGTRGDREHTRSDADGRFVIPAITAGDIELVVTNAGGEDQSEKIGIVPDGEERTDITIALTDGARIAGQVLWPNGRAADGAQVRVLRAGRPWANREETVSDGDGRFQLHGLRGARFEVTARAVDETGDTSHWWRARSGEVDAGASDLLLVLEPGDRLVGRVVDDRGEPLDRFTVRATPLDETLRAASGGSVRERVRGGGGEFTLEGLAPGPWDVWAEARGHADAPPQRVELPEGAGALTFTLPRTGVVRGVVLAAGSPLEGATVSLAGGERPRDKTDEHGAFELDDVPPGRIELVASADGKRDSSPLALAIAPAQELDGVQLALRTGARLEGRVDASIEDYVDRRILASPAGSYEFVRTLCDEQGRFVYEGLEPGRWRVGFDWSSGGGGGEDWVAGYQERREVFVELVEGETAHVVLGRTPPDAVAALCRVTDDGEPQEALLVYVFEAEARDAGERSVQPITIGRTDAEGLCRIVLPRPGPYVFTVGETQGDQVVFRRDVPEAADVVLEFELPDASLAGRVVGPDGTPSARHPLMLVGSGAPSGSRNLGQIQMVSSADDGTFEFSGLRPGTYRLRTGGYGSSSGGYGVQVIEGISVAEGEHRADLTVELDRAAVVEGGVLGPDGAPAAGVVVRVLTPTGRDIVIWKEVVTDHAGSFRFPEVGAGTVRIVAEGPGDARAEEELELAPGEVARVVLEASER